MLQHFFFFQFAYSLREQLFTRVGMENFISIVAELVCIIISHQNILLKNSTSIQEFHVDKLHRTTFHFINQNNLLTLAMWLSVFVNIYLCRVNPPNPLLFVSVF